MKKFGTMAVLSLALPFTAAAANITNLDSIFRFIKDTLNTILPLIIAAAVVYFVWGMFSLFLAKDEDKSAKAKTTVIYGVIAIFVMVSVWGLVNILSSTFGLSTGTPSNANLDPLGTIPGAK